MYNPPPSLRPAFIECMLSAPCTMPQGTTIALAISLGVCLWLSIGSGLHREFERPIGGPIHNCFPESNCTALEGNATNCGQSVSLAAMAAGAGPSHPGNATAGNQTLAAATQHDAQSSRGSLRCISFCATKKQK